MSSAATAADFEPTQPSQVPRGGPQIALQGLVAASIPRQARDGQLPAAAARAGDTSVPTWDTALMARRRTLAHDPSAQAALHEAVRAHHELLDAEERFDEAMWEARRAGVSVRDLAAAVAMSKSQVSRRYKAV